MIEQLPDEEKGQRFKSVIAAMKFKTSIKMIFIYVFCLVGLFLLVICNYPLLEYWSNHLYDLYFSIVNNLLTFQALQVEILKRLEESKSVLLLIEEQQRAQAEQICNLLSPFKYVYDKCPALCELVSFLFRRLLELYECIYRIFTSLLSFFYTYFPGFSSHISLEEWSSILSVTTLLLFFWKALCWYKALKTFFCAAIVAARAILTLSARHLLGDRWRGFNAPAEIEYPLPPEDTLVDPEAPLISDDNSDNQSVSSGGNSINEATQIAAETYFRERQNVLEGDVSPEALFNELGEGIVQTATNLGSEFIDSSLVLNVTEQVLGDIVREIVQEQQDFPPEVPGGSGVGAQQFSESPIDTSYNDAEAGRSLSYHPTGQGTSNNNREEAGLLPKKSWKWPKFSLKPMGQFRADTNNYFQHEHEINAGLHPRHAQACRAIVPMEHNNTKLSSWFTKLFTEEPRSLPSNPAVEPPEPCTAIVPIERNSIPPWFSKLFAGEESGDVTDLKRSAVSLIQNTFRIVTRGFR